MYTVYDVWTPISILMVHSHTLRCRGWDEMGWAALITRCISVEAFTH